MKKINKEVEGMLSSLSDDILINILSFLPLKTAVTTGILSKRWRSLWTHISNIDIDSPYIGASDRYVFLTSELEKYFGKALSKFTSPFIRKFRLNLCSSFYRRDINWVVLDSWFRELCARNVEEIQITSFDYDTCFLYTPPPTCIFRIHTLVSLKYDLMSSIIFRLPDHAGAINLPNLKKLSLRVVHSQTGLLDKLIRACPSLEDFTLMVMSHRNYGQSADIILCSESMKSLRVVNYLKYRRGGIKVVIDAPNLDYLRVDSPEWSTLCFVNNPVSLKEADIKIFPSPLCLGDGTMSKHFGAVSNIRTLILDRTPTFSAETMFPNLTVLSFLMRSSDCGKLSILLELCPILKELILDFSIEDFDKSSVSLNYAAPCISTKVKRVELKKCGLLLDKHLLNLVRHLLRNAMSLERLILDYSVKGKYVEQDEELEFCKILYEFPAVSMQCQIEFSGRHLKFVGKSGVMPAFTFTPELQSYF